MKNLLPFLFLIFFTHSASGQFGYQKGLIITTNSDTIMCEVPITTSFGNRVTILRDFGKTEIVMPLKDIKYLATATNTYEHITYHKKGKEKHKLMQMLAYGRINLYREYVINTGAPRRSGKMSYQPYTAPTIMYVLRKNQQNILLESENFAETIKPLISEVPELVAKVENKTLTYGELEELINLYNQQF